MTVRHLNLDNLDIPSTATEDLVDGAVRQRDDVDVPSGDPVQLNRSTRLPSSGTSESTFVSASNSPSNRDTSRMIRLSRGGNYRGGNFNARVTTMPVRP